MEVLLLMIIVFWIFWWIIKLAFKFIIWIVEIIFNAFDLIKNRKNNSGKNKFNFDLPFILLTILGLFNLTGSLSLLLTNELDGCIFFGMLSILFLCYPTKRIICYLNDKKKNSSIISTSDTKNVNINNSITNLADNKIAAATNISNNIKKNDSYNNYTYDSFIIDSKINHFNLCLNMANQQTTKEILEVLFDFDDLDKAYADIKKIKSNFMNRNAYEETKLNILDYIINDKFSKCCGNKRKKKEKLKALLDELYVCKRRYPEYKEIFEKYILNIKKYVPID